MARLHFMHTINFYAYNHTFMHTINKKIILCIQSTFMHTIEKMLHFIIHFKKKLGITYPPPPPRLFTKFWVGGLTH